MNEFDDMPEMAPVFDRDLSGFAEITKSDKMPVPFGAGAVMIQQANRDTTARKVLVEREEHKILAKINVLCGTFGDQYVYSWPVKNKKKGQKDVVEGGTIKLANMLARAYGNCQVDCDVTDAGTHLIFKAFFIDYETGLSTARLFQQRKNQNTGMGDIDRQADIIFQIGQSKAIRNVILNALSDFAQHAIEQSKDGLLKKFESQELRDKAFDFIDRVMSRYEISEVAMAAVIGRLRKDWDIRNLAKAYMLCKGIAEGMVSASEAFPTEETAKEIEHERNEDDTALKTRAGRATKPKAEPKPAEETKAAEQEKPAVHQQPGYKAAGPEAAKAEPESQTHRVAFFVDSYAKAESFEAIQALRGEAAAVAFNDADKAKVAESYEIAMKRVKTANAAKANAPKPANPDVFPGDLPKGETLAPATDEFNEESAIEQMEEMFSDLDVLSDVEATRDSLVKTIDKLSPAGVSRVTMFYNTAQHRAKAKAAEVTAGPSTNSQLFGED